MGYPVGPAAAWQLTSSRTIDRSMTSYFKPFFPFHVAPHTQQKQNNGSLSTYIRTYTYIDTYIPYHYIPTQEANLFQELNRM